MQTTNVEGGGGGVRDAKTFQYNDPMCWVGNTLMIACLGVPCFLCLQPLPEFELFKLGIHCSMSKTPKRLRTWPGVTSEMILGALKEFIAKRKSLASMLLLRSQLGSCWGDMTPEHPPKPPTFFGVDIC